MKPLSLRWKFFLLSGAVSLTTMAVVGTMLAVYAFQHLHRQAEDHLVKECDEIVAVLGALEYQPALENFLEIESSSRFDQYRYFIEISEPDGRTFASSNNLGAHTLPRPQLWTPTRDGQLVSLMTFPGMIANSAGPFLIRSEQSSLRLHDGGSKPLIVQAAVSLGEWKTRMLRTLALDSIVAAVIVFAIVALTWFVTTMTLRPVAAMTLKAARINAQNLGERIPIHGRSDELDKLAAVLNRMLDDLSDSLRRTAEFSANASHQMRTPLTKIRAQLELMLSAEIPPAFRDNLESLQKQVVRLSRLCSRLLLLGRLELHSGEANSMNERVDLAEVVDEIVEQHKPAAYDRGVAVETGKTGQVVVCGNRILLVEACLNLLDNALRWAPRGSCVRVSATSRDGEAVLLVTDSGPGVPDHERANIFRPFYRGERTSASPGDVGFGLGLSIVRAIAELHSGHIELLQSSTAQGSTFSLTLPLDLR